MSMLSPIVFALLILIAFAAWIFAVAAALEVVKASPRGEKFSNYMRLGLMQFGTIESRVGPSIRPALTRFRNGVLAFFGCVILAVVTSFVSIGLAE